MGIGDWGLGTCTELAEVLENQETRETRETRENIIFNAQCPMPYYLNLQIDGDFP
ncbi:hypothetical protein [Nostoc sp. CMAA1605]|uniref:hypothetical protein n=1 Tax=Nostoc sp. CMAA1605 TaxID=2055159 RepID=UPI001F1B82FB|nr:hypothetical protein [Nostoc sp. CMAA1605]